MDDTQLAGLRQSLVDIVAAPAPIIVRTRHGDEADQGNSSREADMAIDVLRAMHQKRIRAQAALLRMRENQYGKCLKCGDEISYERLELLPYAEFCSDHKEEPWEFYV